MKNFKKIMAVALCSVMLFGASMTAMASEQTENKIENENVESTSANCNIDLSQNDTAIKFTYGQILELDKTSKDGWKFVEDVEHVGYTVDSLKALAKDNGETLATTGTRTTSADLAAAAEYFSTYAKTTAEGNVKVTSAGLYVIKANKTGAAYASMLVFVEDGRTQDITLKVKGSDIIINKKVAENKSAEAVYSQEEVDYVIEVVYPYLGEGENSAFEINDTITNAKFNDESVVVSISGVDESAVLGETTTVKDNTLNVKFNYNKKYADKTITVTYKAKVNKMAKTVSVNNDAEIKETMLNGEEVNIVLSESKIVSPSAEFVLKKTDDSTDSNPLKDATFAIYMFDEAQTGITYSQLTEGSDTAFASLTTDKDGKAKFIGLDPTKYYYLVETKAPTGYSINTKVEELVPLEVTPKITTDNSNGHVITTTTYVIKEGASYGDKGVVTVVDSKLSTLPFTGGTGTYIFTIAGILIMIGAVVLFFRTKNKR